MSKKKLNAVAAVMIIIVMALGLFLILTREPQKDVADCQETDPVEAQVEFIDATSSGFEINGETVDSLTIEQCGNILVTNESDENIDLAFGNHDNHQDYPTFSEQTVEPGEFVEIIMTKHGEFTLHDHLREDRTIDITVTKDENLIQYTKDELYDVAPGHEHESESSY